MIRLLPERSIRSLAGLLAAVFALGVCGCTFDVTADVPIGDAKTLHVTYRSGSSARGGRP